MLWSRLLSVTNEQQAALMRTAFSTVVRESQDLACGVFDTRGNMVAQSETGTPGHINAMATCMRHFMAAYPSATLEPGDVLITNDPWMTAGQINDITLVTPIFLDGRVVAYFANTCHMVDIGGRILSAEAREVYEEGFLIPITKLFRRGRAQRGAVQAARWPTCARRARSRATCTPWPAATTSAARSCSSSCASSTWTASTRCREAIIERSERAMRAAIARLPDGVYENEVYSRRLRGAGPAQSDGDRRRRRADRRPRRQLAAESLRHQRGHELHPRLHQLRRQVRDLARSAAQRGQLPTGARHGARRAAS